MATVTAGSPPVSVSGIRHWLTRYGVYLVAVLFFAAFGAKFLRDDEESLWRTTYVLAAQEMFAGEQIYHLGNYCYAYPPAMALYSMPLAFLPADASLFGWYCVNVLATCVTFTCAWRLVGGPKFTEMRGTWIVVFWLGILLAGRHVLSPLENRQSDMCIAAFAMAGCLALAKRREGWAGVLLGIAASMKLTPLLFVPYLAIRGRWRAAAIMATVCLGVNLVPDLLFPQQSGHMYLAEWRRVFFTEAKATAPGQWAQEDPIGQLRLNQSLAALYHRYVMFGLPSSPEEIETYDLQMSPAAHATIRWLTHGTALALLAATAWLMRRPAGVSPLNRGGELQVAIDAGAVLSLMVLISPMSSKAHYVVLLLPALVIARLAVERRTAALVAVTAALLITGTLTSKGVISKPIGETLALWGLPTYFPLACLAGMWLVQRMLVREGRESHELTDASVAAHARAA